MSTEKFEHTRCDLCYYGGEWSRPADFVRVGTVDLCRWCAQTGPLTSLSSGHHKVTFDGERWTCSYAARYSAPLFVPPRVREAVPNMQVAAANFHVQHGTCL